MKKHLLSVLICVTAMALSCPVRAQKLIAVHDETGRTVWVNDDAPKPQPAPASVTKPNTASRYSNLVYWSSKDHKWKPIPRASSSTMRAARQAAQEVSDYVAKTPATSTTGGTKSASGVKPESLPSPDVDSLIQTAATRHGVDPNLVRAIVRVESNFNPKAVSSKGAMGLMQLMPGTARSLSVTNAFDPNQNVDAGVRHFKSLLDSYHGNVELSLAAYNAGSGAVRRNKGVPPYRETQAYVRKITQMYWNGPTAPVAPRFHVSRDAAGHIVISDD